MSLRHTFAGLGLLLAACSGGGERPPDIVVISVDTLAHSALRAFDASAEPLAGLDALAAESVRFRNAYSTASWTLPSHASLLTGLYPDRHGATDQKVTMASDVATLAGELARRGYQTAGFNGGGFLDDQYGLGRGFEVYASFQKTKQGPAESGAQLVDRVRAFLNEERDPSRPLFLFVHSYAVHNYYDASPAAVRASGLGKVLPRKQYVDCLVGRKAGTPGVWDQMRTLYRSELDVFDEDFRRLRQLLFETDETVVVLLSDHGEGFDPERARIHHGGRLHEDQIRIPLLVRGPGMEPRDEETPISLIDVMPTLLELAGLTPPRELDGRSLVPLLYREGSLPARPLYAMEHFFTWENGRRFRSKDVHAAPLAMALVQENDWYIKTRDAEELYDMGADPRQGHDLAGGEPRLEALRALMEERWRERAATGARAADARLDADLEDLGYGGGD